MDNKSDGNAKGVGYSQESGGSSRDRQTKPHSRETQVTDATSNPTGAACSVPPTVARPVSQLPGSSRYGFQGLDSHISHESWTIVGSVPWATQQPRGISTEAHKFVNEVPFKDIVQCANFIQSHPNLLAEDGINSQLLSAAKESLEHNDSSRAENFVEKALIIKKCQGSSGREMTDFFRGLYVRDHEFVGEFDLMFNDVMSHLRREVANDLIPSSYKKAVPSPGGDNISQSMDHRTRALPVRFLRDGVVSKHARPDELRIEESDHWTKRRAQSSPEHSIMPTRSFYREDRCVIRPSTFFSVGRVFALEPYEQLGGSHRDTVGFPLRTVTVERTSLYAVVKEGHGFCLAVPISTYGRLGLSKPGLNKDDIRAHAIIYLFGTSSHWFPAEPSSGKIPISVDASSPGAHLPTASRINFAKTNTIEHNVRTMDIGRVSARSMLHFQSYWREEILR